MNMDTKEKVSEEDINPGDHILAEGIDWDTDDANPISLNLPNNVDLKIPSDWNKGDSVSDILSDHFGYCIHGIATLTRV